nr:MAG TPA: hypothetical protein [Caudoviricetes sp.]
MLLPISAFVISQILNDGDASSRVILSVLSSSVLL